MVLAASISLVSLNACAPERDSLRIGIVGEPTTLDPHLYSLGSERKILNDLFTGLTTVTARGEIVGGAARSWSASEDGLRWEFELRRNLKWSDGQALNAQDFVYSFRRLFDPATVASLGYFLHCIRNAESVSSGELPAEKLGVKTLGNHRLLIELTDPFPFLPERLLHPTSYPVPKHVIDKHGNDWTKPENWVSNGAYVLNQWQPKTHIDIIKNVHFHAAVDVRIESIRYRIGLEESSAHAQYRAEELDIIDEFPSAELPWLQENLPDEIRTSPSLSIIYIVFNVSEPPFDDRRVREALALAVNRERITDLVLKGGEVPSYGVVPPFVANYESPVVPVSTNPDLSRRLLESAGFSKENPLEITLRHISRQEFKQVSTAVATMWQGIGVKVELQHSNLQDHLAVLREGEFTVAQAGWYGENNPEHYLVELLMSDTSNANYGRFKSRAFDALMNKTKRTANPNKRLKLLITAESIGLRSYPVIPLYAQVTRSLVSQRVGGWAANSRDIHGSRYLFLR